jgi:hypothetical protein
MLIKLKALLLNAKFRLAARAVVAGVSAFVALYTSGDGSSSAFKAAAVAGVLAALEVFTPLNALVGFNKQIG